MSVDDVVPRSTPTIDLVSIDSADDPLLPAFQQLFHDFLTELGENLEYQEVEQEIAARQPTQRWPLGGAVHSMAQLTLLVCVVFMCAVPGKYSRSLRGCMYVAVDRSSPPAVPGLDISSIPARAVGIVSLRRLEGDIGEVKRMYVDPQYRGHKIAYRLMTTIIQQAIAFQYTKLRLDTLARLQAANRLYARMGFYTIPAYNDCVIAGASWHEMDLSAQVAGTGTAADNTTLH